MRWSVWVDFARALSADEQTRVFEAVDAIVPDSGCVGPNASGRHELYFAVSAGSADEARSEAARHVASALGAAKVDCDTELTVHPHRS